MNGPLPTRLVFIHELPSLPLHTKVRFLGCVAQYDIKKGRLELEHNFPPSPSKDAKHKPTTKIAVDIYHVLDSINTDQLQVGAWLNIFGYVRKEEKEQSEKSTNDIHHHVYVQAVMISDAGAIRVAEYEQSVSDMQAINQILRHA